MALGPFLVSVLKRAKWTAAIVDGFVLASIIGIVLFHILPESIAILGFWSIGIGVAGLLAPIYLEKVSNLDRIPTHSAIALGLLALMIHTWLDGVALGASEELHGGAALSLAIVLHRLPVGIGLWWIVRPKWGKRGAWFVIAATALSTAIGFFFAPSLGELVTDDILMGLQTFVGGSLLHVVLHESFVEAEERSKWGELFGVVMGFGLMLIIPLFDPHDHDHAGGLHHYADTFWDLVFESAPALVLGYFLAGVLSVALPHLPVRWMNRGPRVVQAAKGTAVGLPIPICSCGVVPLYQSMVKSGVSSSAAMAFMIATPELGIEALLLSIPLLGVEITIARVIGAAVVALAAGVIVSQFVKPVDADPETEKADDMTFAEKAKFALNKGFVEVLDDTAPWIFLGIAIAAFFGPDMTIGWIEALPNGADVVVFALLGIPVYVCASGSTPLAAAMIFAGASPGAAVAFILSGPATNVTTFGVLSNLHSRQVSVIFGVVVFAFSVATGLIVNLVITVGTASHDHAHHHAWEWWQWGAVVILGLAVLGSVFRMGPRGFLSVLSLTGHHHHHDHDHHHGDGHSHHGHGCCGHDH